MEWRDGLEGRIGGTAWREGMEGRKGGTNWWDGSKRWIVGWPGDWSGGWTNKRMEGCCFVVLILFSRKATFSYFRRKSIFAKNEIFAFSWAIFAKKKMIFVRIFAKIYFFRPNSRRLSYRLIA